MDGKRKFNILHIDGFRKFGGAQTDMAVLLKFMELRHGGSFNFYVIHNGNERFKEELDSAGINNVSVKMRNFMDIGAVVRIRTFIKANGIDLINFHSSLDHFLGGVAAVSVSLSGKRIIKVLTRHVAYKISFIKGFFIYRFLTDGFIAISDYIKNRLVSDMKIDPGIISTIYSPRIFSQAPAEGNAAAGNDAGTFDSYSANQDIRNILGVLPGEKTIVLIGRLSGEKGHETFIEAAGLLVKKGRNDLRFVVIGEGELYGRIKEMIEAKGLGGRFIVTGFKKDIKRYIAAADLIVVPSGLEGMGSIIIESCAMKKAVIASDVGGIPEVIKDGETGVLFKAGDSEEFAVKIDRLSRDGVKIEKLGLNCYNEVVKKFDACKIADETAAFYLNLLKCE